MFGMLQTAMLVRDSEYFAWSGYVGVKLARKTVVSERDKSNNVRDINDNVSNTFANLVLIPRT